MSFSSLASLRATREVLRSHGLTTKKHLGQHFLIDDHIIGKILALADVRQTDHVVEIGPGIGTLTVALLERASQVTAVECDSDLSEVLLDECAPWVGSFSLLQKDALEVTQKDLSSARPNKLVANLPYAVAATIVLDYFCRFSYLESATVMVQKEVADRMCAKAGVKTYGAYTVKLSLYTQVKDCFSVHPQSFYPSPHVESTVVRLDRQRDAQLDKEVLDAAALMADAAFAARRKTILNSMKQFFSGRGQDLCLSPSDILDILHKTHIDSDRRGETLSCEEFLALGRTLCARR